MIDPCAVLDQSVSKQLGLTAAAETFGGPTACSIEMTDPSGDTSTYTLYGDSEIKPTSPQFAPTGTMPARIPVLGRSSDAGSCDRVVFAQNGAPVGIEMSVLMSHGDACAPADTGLAAAIRRLAVNPPLLKRDPKSAFRVDPCALPNSQSWKAAIGDPAVPKPNGTHACDVNGSDFRPCRGRCRVGYRSDHGGGFGCAAGTRTGSEHPPRSTDPGPAQTVSKRAVRVKRVPPAARGRRAASRPVVSAGRESG